MRLPDEVQKCVVFFGIKMPDKKTGSERIRYGGTGFFVSIASSIPGADFTVLVTARHVAERLEHGEFYIRVNRKDGTAIEYRVEGGIDAVWHFHPTDMSVDAAIAIWSPSYEDDTDYLCIPGNMFLDEKKIKEKGIGTGDEVYITGLFRLLYGRQRNVPIVRTGSLAMLSSDRVPVKDWHTEDVEAYLVEARSIGASSGSPVFVQRSIKQHWREKHLHHYLAEFDFRYNHRSKLGYNDLDRTIAALRGAEGKRLTYHQPRSA